MRFPRSGGVLVHPTCLPSQYGIGDLGASAYDLVDFLVQAGQSLWQILPLGPTGYADSPYQSFSAFAGNPMLISPAKMVEAGLMSESMVEKVPDFPRKQVDYGEVIRYKQRLLRAAYNEFIDKRESDLEAFQSFCKQHDAWLDDYALFMALKEHHQDVEGGIWNRWPKDIALRQPSAIKEWTERLEDDIVFHKFNQYVFYKQWLAIRRYANDRGIRIVGDVPIFVAYDSADVWSNPELFFLEADGSPTVVAGVPPDYFSETGQRWGNPLYRWDLMARNDYAWWKERLQMIFEQVDVVRIDHFRGFDAYWEIPAEEPTAVVGRWVKGPGKEFFESIKETLGQLPIIAEDLGVITPQVERLRDAFDFPGMKILQFAFGGERNSSFLPHNFGRNCVVYTGTHDNETTKGWYQNAAEEDKDHVRRYIARDGADIPWDLIRLAYASVADSAVVPMQDLMGLGNEARMNYPGKTGGWWSWRFTSDMLTDQIAERLKELTHLYGRIPLVNEAPDLDNMLIEDA